MQEPASPSVTVPELAAGAASLAFCCWYYFAKHWLANNALGLAFSIQGIEHLSLGAVSTGVCRKAGHAGKHHGSEYSPHASGSSACLWLMATSSRLFHASAAVGGDNALYT